MRLRHTTHARDAALGQLERANRWLVVGSVALTAVFAELASQAFPGHKSAPAKAKAQSKATHHQTSTAPLQPPARTPEPHVSESEREERSQGEVEEPASPETAPAEPSQAPSEAAPPSSEPESHAEAPVETHEAPPQETAPPVVSGGS
jgi:hypothetical protein